MRRANQKRGRHRKCTAGPSEDCCFELLKFVAAAMVAMGMGSEMGVYVVAVAVAVAVEVEVAVAVAAMSLLFLVLTPPNRLNN